MNLFLPLVTLFAIFACASTPWAGPFPLIESDPISVRECRLVGKYPGSSGYRYWGPPPVLADFKYRTAVKAGEAGATHIYWREDISGIQTMVTGYAFDCTGVAMPKYGEDVELY